MFSEISRFRGFEVSRFRVIHLHLLLLHFNITISWFTQVANFEYSLRLQGTLSNFQAVCTLICNVQRVIINFASICRCIGRCLDRWRMSLDRHETQHSEDPTYPLLHVAFTHRTMWVFFWLFSRHLLSPLSSLLFRNSSTIYLLPLSILVATLIAPHRLPFHHTVDRVRTRRNCGCKRKLDCLNSTYTNVLGFRTAANERVNISTTLQWSHYAIR